MHLLHGGDSPDRINQEQAIWLAGQIGAGWNEQGNDGALLAYLKQEAASMHPLLEPLYERLEASYPGIRRKDRSGASAALVRRPG